MRFLYIGYNGRVSLKKWGQSVEGRNLRYPFLRGQPLKCCAGFWNLALCSLIVNVAIIYSSLYLLVKNWVLPLGVNDNVICLGVCLAIWGSVSKSSCKSLCAAIEFLICKCQIIFTSHRWQGVCLLLLMIPHQFFPIILSWCSLSFPKRALKSSVTHSILCNCTSLLTCCSLS